MAGFTSEYLAGFNRNPHYQPLRALLYVQQRMLRVIPYTQGHTTLVTVVDTPPPSAAPGMAGFHATGAKPVFATVRVREATAPHPAEQLTVGRIIHATPAKPAALPPPPKPKPLPTWTIQRGETLSAALAAWCKRAGWDPPQWTSPYNQTALASVAFRGTFTGAVQQLFQAYKAAGAGEAGYHPLRVQLYVDQHLLRVIPATTDQDAR